MLQLHMCVMIVKVIKCLSCMRHCQPVSHTTQTLAVSCEPVNCVLYQSGVLSVTRTEGSLCLAQYTGQYLKSHVGTQASAYM